MFSVFYIVFFYSEVNSYGVNYGVLGVNIFSAIFDLFIRGQEISDISMLDPVPAYVDFVHRDNIFRKIDISLHYASPTSDIHIFQTRLRSQKA